MISVVTSGSPLARTPARLGLIQDGSEIRHRIERSAIGLRKDFRELVAKAESLCVESTDDSTCNAGSTIGQIVHAEKPTWHMERVQQALHRFNPEDWNAVLLDLDHWL
jgi:hypothetical protein